ncbi:hypothetical protein D9M72_592490 [compost metagenome]
MPLLAVIEGACNRDGAVIDIHAVSEHLLDVAKRHRRRRPTLLDRRQQAFLPVQPLHLPGAERDKDGEGEGEQ